MITLPDAIDIFRNPSGHSESRVSQAHTAIILMLDEIIPADFKHIKDWTDLYTSIGHACKLNSVSPSDAEKIWDVGMAIYKIQTLRNLFIGS